MYLDSAGKLHVDAFEAIRITQDVLEESEHGHYALSAPDLSFICGVMRILTSGHCAGLSTHESTRLIGLYAALHLRPFLDMNNAIAPEVEPAKQPEPEPEPEQLDPRSVRVEIRTVLLYDILPGDADRLGSERALAFADSIERLLPAVDRVGRPVRGTAVLKKAYVCQPVVHRGTTR